ncbi:hypothetical protein ACIBO5_53430 [Nonomuraea angiospora]|uniref:hypothetical protein n=1 Tax=Nonomuraea angiospora TaxID=46172 RepID=UPI0037A16C2C
MDNREIYRNVSLPPVHVNDASGAGQRLTLAVTALSVSWLLGTAVGRRIAAAREAVPDAVRLLPHEAALGLLGLPADPATDLTRAGGLPALTPGPACPSRPAGRPASGGTPEVLRYVPRSWVG